MDQQRPAAKKRKLTDKALPSTILSSPNYAVDSQMYQDLIAMERRLDWTMSRKKAEVQDALIRTVPTTRTLRLFLSHTVSGQSWQQGTDPTAADASGETKPNLETGEGIPAWQFRIEGRLLEIPNQRSKDRAPPRKFSTLIKHMVIELERDPAQYPDGNIVEWARLPPNQQQPQDGFTVRRLGDSTTKIRVVIHLDQQPEVFKVLPELGNILGIKEETKMGVVQALWNYIKEEGLQDKLERRTIRADAKLRQIFGAESFPFNQIPERVNRFLAPPDPILLHYTINPSLAPPEKPSAWDVEVKMDDTNLRNRMNGLVIGVSQETSRELVRLDEEVSLLTQSLTNSHLKYTFLDAFASNPQGFMQTWLESQSRDLESVLGSGPSEGATLRQDDLRRAEYFKLPWVEEAVAIMEGQRKAGKVGLS
ncbi:SWI/SNF complex component snf12 [Steccherinum ochraceum]|uniref:SWI/SNF complex component snf12 n=1 Tax=Steccherinum ochraceum TaxID=92696 RepID=A0A4R0RC16_9APHY|nr:SWI/SNF complex component snf12 [Steccherinum ochraceum]